MTTVIEVQNLVKEYRIRRLWGREVFTAAVRGVSFSVSKGEIFGLLGPNGAGKTTTLEILEGIRQLSGGKVMVLGMDVNHHASKIKKYIGVQLQTSEYLPLITLREQLELFGSLYSVKVNPYELLRFVNLEEKIDAYVKELSGGQKQRFTIVSALVHAPHILFLDEPTTGLDPGARRKLWQLIRTIQAEGTTIVLTTHYMEEAEYLCDRVAIMDKGQILTIDNPKTLINQLAHTTQVSFFTDDEISKEMLQHISVIEKVYSNYPKVIIELSSLDAVGQILQVLKDKHVRFTGFTVKTATLEDVYLDLTGQELTTDHI